MIRATITYKESLIKEIRVKGHADSGKYGNDLVCAGVSTILTGIVNMLAKKDFLTRGTIALSQGNAHIIVHESTKEDQLILETLVTCLETMEADYGKYIKMIKKEA